MLALLQWRQNPHSISFWNQISVKNNKIVYFWSWKCAQRFSVALPNKKSTYYLVSTNIIGGWKHTNHNNWVTEFDNYICIPLFYVYYFHFPMIQYTFVPLHLALHGSQILCVVWLVISFYITSKECLRRACVCLCVFIDVFSLINTHTHHTLPNNSINVF